MLNKRVWGSLLAGVLLLSGCGVQGVPKTAGTGSTVNGMRTANWDFREESIYFVMPDRFVDGDPNNNNLFGDEYRPGNLSFNQGGDFKGLIQHLDHIKDMGFTAIWITPPVMQPPGRYQNGNGNYEGTGYHGYWAWDFSKIDPHLESPGATYDDFIKACHAKGIKVVQDIVTNHGHGLDANPSTKWYADRNKVWGLGREFDFANDTHQWFNHSGDKIADLMDFNDKSPTVTEWFNKIFASYQDRGVDAFRIDTVAWMEPQFWANFTDAMHANKANFFMFGEAWTNSASDWLASYTKLGTRGGDHMNNGMSLLDMPGSAMNTWGQNSDTFKEGGDYQRVDSVMSQDHRYADATYLVTYLDNHDKPRFNAPEGAGRGASTENYLDALNWYFTARGIPCIYYGTEIQMQGGQDPDNRRVLGVNGINASKNNPVYLQLKKLNALRQAFIPLQKGKQVKLAGGRDTYAFRRDFANETALVFLNKSGQGQTLQVSGVPDGSYTELSSGQAVTVSGGNASAQVPAHGVVVLAKGRINGGLVALKQKLAKIGKRKA